MATHEASNALCVQNIMSHRLPPASVTMTLAYENQHVTHATLISPSVLFVYKE